MHGPGWGGARVYKTIQEYLSPPKKFFFWGYPQIRMGFRAANSLMGLIWCLGAPPGDSCIFAIDSRWRWDSGTYKATLQYLPHQEYVQDMAKLGLIDIAPELLQEMSDQSNHKQRYDTDAMQQVRIIWISSHAKMHNPPRWAQKPKHWWSALTPLMGISFPLHHLCTSIVGSNMLAMPL